jgi:hypothetical protein
LAGGGMHPVCAILAVLDKQLVRHGQYSTLNRLGLV